MGNDTSRSDRELANSIAQLRERISHSKPNSVCADCFKGKPEYVDLYRYGIFLCAKCTQIHRELDSQVIMKPIKDVKDVDDKNLRLTQIDCEIGMNTKGNPWHNAVWMFKIISFLTDMPKSKANTEEMEMIREFETWVENNENRKIIEAKYIHRKWIFDRYTYQAPGYNTNFLSEHHLQFAVEQQRAQTLHKENLDNDKSNSKPRFNLSKNGEKSTISSKMASLLSTVE